MAPALSGGGDAGELRREALSKVPGCEDGRAPIAVAPLHGGTSNAAFRVQTRLGSFVMRLNEPEAAQLGVDRAREAALHRAAAAAGLAPAVAYADAAGRFLITEFMAGHGWSPRDMGDWHCLAELGAVLGRLHALAPPAVSTDANLPAQGVGAVSTNAHSFAQNAARPARSERAAREVGDERPLTPSSGASAARTSPDGGEAHSAFVVSPFALAPLLRHHAARAIEANPGEAEHLTDLVGRAESILAASNAGGARTPSIIHNDLHHSNLIGSGHRLCLVDWEYAAVADPLYDLACLLAYYPQAEPHSVRLLEVTGLAAGASVDELADIAWVYVLLSYLWYRTRGLLAPASSQDREAELALRQRLGI